MAEDTEPEQVEGLPCFHKRICRYFNEYGLSKFALPSWRTLAGPPVGGSAGEELSLDAKLKMLKSNLTKFEKSLRDGRVKHLPEFLRSNGLNFAHTVMRGEVTPMEDFTLSNGLQHPLVHPEAVTAVCSYLLYLVSSHGDPSLVSAAANTLSYHIESGATFAPDRAQILAIALNMGMDEKYLLDFSQDQLPQYARDAGSTGCQALEQYPEPFHVQQVVDSLTELLRPDRRWTEAARDTLFDVLIAMLIDPYMERIMVTSHVTECLDQLLQGYEDSVWRSDSDSTTGKLLDLAERLEPLPLEAHIPVLRGLPPLGRGHELRRLAGYLYLQRRVIDDQLPDSCGSAADLDLSADISVGLVLKVVRESSLGRRSSADGQSVSYYALLRCVDAAVGTERPPREQLNDLDKLKALLHLRISQVALNEDEKPDLQMRQKEFMTILCSKWSDMCMKRN